MNQLSPGQIVLDFRILEYERDSRVLFFPFAIPVTIQDSTGLKVEFNC